MHRLPIFVQLSFCCLSNKICFCCFEDSISSRYLNPRRFRRRRRHHNNNFAVLLFVFCLMLDDGLREKKAKKDNIPFFMIKPGDVFVGYEEDDGHCCRCPWTDGELISYCLRRRQLFGFRAKPKKTKASATTLPFLVVVVLVVVVVVV